MHFAAIPPLTLLALIVTANATSPISTGFDTPALPHTPAPNSAPALWQRWFALPESTPDVDPTRRSVRHHGPRRRTVHP
ncbi:hypothetical protein DFH06DRAFT_1246585 [Mycena polygramma]|nr:hypothetical protein DFH06DRAFT_1246585 [Mycena polygramma]